MRMTREEALGIYKHPKGHSKGELHECLKVLDDEPVLLSSLQFEAIKDAHARLGVRLE